MQTRSFEQIRSSLEDIIFDIQSGCTNCEWYIPVEKIISALNIRKEDYYRIFYDLRNEVHFSSRAAAGFNETQADSLIQLLSKILKIEGIGDEFAKSGIYFDDNHLAELQINLKENIQNRLERHELDKELLLLLSSATIDFDDAFDSYFDDKFNFERIVVNGISDFMESKSIQNDYGADVFLKNHIFSILNTKLFHLREITREYRDRAYYELFGSFRKKPKKKKPVSVFQEMDPETQRHLDVLGFDAPCTLEELKKRFKELIKKYHPDINKDGLEMTQRIIASYNFLIMRMS
ncbi:J domain-containing protein [Leptospira stimsonii]|uniref:J domain-containing protein n=1 Tax=Leptospira stimsonii TaxID=2202203 RepID=A0A4R9L1C9_9LEPT|nr:molecular chaperone DnaJ [Leptospira stimsonii]RHX92592.1 molecular chaperone DnaJ [Leptospira stimsonii]TGK23891.1 J domain-containing protein [Leptospira stimsonii]TGM10401.1 J domain-containing protein [Leptospira stimsonii]